jgi:hypothetical protein
MTRRRLWLVTTISCAVLALPTVVRLIGLVAPLDAWRATMTTTLTRLGSGAASASRDAIEVGRRWISAAAVGIHGALQHSLTPGAVAQWRAVLPMVLAVALGLAVVVLAAGLIIRRRSRSGASVPRRVRGLARRGTSIHSIAARTGLAQDAVRQMLRPQQAISNAGFGDLLAASLDPALPSPAGPRRDR